MRLRTERPTSFVGMSGSGWPHQIQRTGVTPFPVADLRHVLAIAVDIVFVLDQLVLQLPLQVRVFTACLWQADYLPSGGVAAQPRGKV